MNIVNPQYYMPREIQTGLNLSDIQGTSILDPVQALYSDEGLDKDDTMYDPYNITTRNFNRGKSPIPEVKILVPEGYRDVLSLDTTT